MNFWVWFWGCLLATTLLLYACLTIIVAIGGFRDMRAMFRNLESQRKKKTGSNSTAEKML